MSLMFAYAFLIVKQDWIMHKGMICTDNNFSVSEKLKSAVLWNLKNLSARLTIAFSLIFTMY